MLLGEKGLLTSSLSLKPEGSLLYCFSGWYQQPADWNFVIYCCLFLCYHLHLFPFLCTTFKMGCCQLLQHQVYLYLCHFLALYLFISAWYLSSVFIGFFLNFVKLLSSVFLKIDMLLNFLLHFVILIIFLCIFTARIFFGLKMPHVI